VNLVSIFLPQEMHNGKRMVVEVISLCLPVVYIIKSLTAALNAALKYNEAVQPNYDLIVCGVNRNIC
jgi:hypothetical protein